MPEAPLGEVLRGIVREEVAPLEKKMDAGFERMDQRFDELKMMLEGLIDEDYPPVDQQSSRSGGPPAISRLAAKSR